MAPSIDISGLKPEEDYELFPKIELDEEYYDGEWVEVQYKVRKRSEWGAKPSKRKHVDRPLWKPVRFLVLSSFHTQQPGTPTRASVMQEMQRRDMERGLPDIQCNIAFGEDGLVYEGREWEFRPGNSSEYPGFEGHYAEFTFIGNYKAAPARRSVMQYIRLSKTFQFVKNDVRLLEDKRYLKEDRLEIIKPTKLFDLEI